MNRLPNLSDSQFATLTNALMAASDKFKANAVEFQNLKPKLQKQEREKPELMALIHSSACDPMSKQFEQQVKDVAALLEFIEEETVDV